MQGSYIFSPAPVYVYSPPKWGVIYGKKYAIDKTLGMPLVQIYDETGTLQLENQAVYVSSDGSILEIPMTPLPEGIFTGFISQETPTGMDLIGTFPIKVLPGSAPVPDVTFLPPLTKKTITEDSVPTMLPLLPFYPRK